MNVGISLNDVEIKSLRAILDPRQYRQALYQATQRATRKGRVAAGKAVKARLPLRRKFIDDPDSRDAAIKSEFDRNAQTGKIITTQIGVPLSEFPHRESKKGVSVSIDSTRPRLELRHAFKAKVASAAQIAQAVSHVGIFTRDRNIDARLGELYRYRGKQYKIGKNAKGFMWRISIRERLGPSVWGLVRQDDILKPIVANIANLFHKELDGQISRFTTGKYKSLASVVAEFGGIAADTDQA